MKRFLSACAVLIVVAVAGCGSSAGSGAADPATLAPATTLAYASVVLAPEGDQQAGFDAAFGKLLGADPERRIGEGLTRAIRTGDIEYGADVEPWLGTTATAILTGVADNGPDFALLLESTDDDRARAAIDKDLSGSNPIAREYRGVAYKTIEGGIANGVVDHFLVAGTENAFKAVVDTSKDGKSLAGSEQWKKSVGDRADGKAGLAYLDLKALLQSFAARLPGAQRLAAPLLLGLVQIQPFVATMDANADELVFDLSSPGTAPDPRGPAAASSSLIERLPADSWAALALPQVGKALGTLTDALKANPLIAAHYQRALAQVRARTGLDLEKDVLAAVGDVGLFARGSTAATVGGGLVVTSSRPATLTRTMRRLSGLIGAKHGRILVRGSKRGAIAATGAASLRAAQHPGTRLGAAPLFQKARAAIGERPTFFIDFAPALQLAGSSPHHRDDPHFQKALPRLQHLQYLAAGARREGNLDVVRVVLGLR